MRQLSQDEIDRVFRSHQGASTKPAEKRAAPFDFEKPDRIPKSQLRAIRFLHENFVRALSSRLSAYLRAYVSGHLVSVEQIPYSTFLDGLPPHSGIVSMSLLPYGDNAALEINPSLTFPILEILLGGKATPVNDVTRELSDMERYLLSSFFDLITTELEQSWKEIDEVEFRIDLRDTKLRSARSLGPTEAVVAIGMEFSVDDTIGMINLAMPSITIKSMVQKFEQQATWNETPANGADRTKLLKLLGRGAVTIEPRLLSRLNVKDLLALKTGSIVLLDHFVEQPVIGTANGQDKFEGAIICENDKRHFLIGNVTNPVLPDLVQNVKRKSKEDQ